MKWSFKLGRILGVDVYVHATFLLLLGFIGLSHGLAGRSLEAALNGVFFFAGLFVCVLLHEYGHALAARRYGIGTRDLTLLPIGGVAKWLPTDLPAPTPLCPTVSAESGRMAP